MARVAIVPSFNVHAALARHAAGVLPRTQWRWGMMRTGTVNHLFVGDPTGIGEWYAACGRHNRPMTNAECDKRPSKLAKKFSCTWCDRACSRATAVPQQGIDARSTLGRIARLSTAEEIERRAASNQINPEGVILAEIHVLAVTFFLSGGGKT